MGIKGKIYLKYDQTAEGAEEVYKFLRSVNQEIAVDIHKDVGGLFLEFKFYYPGFHLNDTIKYYFNRSDEEKLDSVNSGNEPYYMSTYNLLLRKNELTTRGTFSIVDLANEISHNWDYLMIVNGVELDQDFNQHNIDWIL